MGVWLERSAMRKATVAALAFVVAASARDAGAQGFQLDRYEPTAAGTWFFAAPHPWYSSTRYAAAGLTLDYGHNPLLGGTTAPDGSFQRRVSIVEHQLVGHVDVAGSYLDRVQLSATLPVVFYEAGTAAYGAAPAASLAVGDPRVGAMARIWGQPDLDPVSVHAAIDVWIPVGAQGSLTGDPNARVRPEVIVAGRAVHHVRWAFSAGAVIRGSTSVGVLPAGSIGSELVLRGGVGWGDAARSWNVGPEFVFTTPVSGGLAGTRAGTSLEVLGGAQWNIARVVQFGAAVGVGALPTYGTPDARVLFRAAWSPIRTLKPGDLDGDGVPDASDACPDVAGAYSKNGRYSGCSDRDGDGVPDGEDVCPDKQSGALADRRAAGCPAPDRDGDGVPDADDVCPDVKNGAHPDAKASGCPQPDRDGDGVPDGEDVCPDLRGGTHPGPDGCPMPDADADGVPDAEDACPRSAAGQTPDSRRAGCPLPDGDGDGIPDEKDACPKLAGAASDDTKRNGCPRMDAIGGSQTELKSVLFPRNEATLLPVSFPVLDEVARLIAEHPRVAEVVIEGHADDTGTSAWNMRLSRKRAEAVVQYLVSRGVRAGRLRPVGFGDTRPVANDGSEEGRARNRRVEMRVPSTAGKRP